MIEPVLVSGLMVLAGVYANKITINCSNCNELQQKELYCSGISQYPVFEDDIIGVFYSCPLKLLNSIIYEFADEMNYLEAFPSAAKPYGEHNERFWSAYKTYKSAYNKLAYPDAKKGQNTEKKTEDSLQALRKSFSSRKKK